MPSYEKKGGCPKIKTFIRDLLDDDIKLSNVAITI